MHPFERAREYTRAVVATKLDKIFAKPFVGALDGHKDAVYCMSSVRNKNVPFISGSCDGEIKVWDLAQRKCFWSQIAHTGFVRGVTPDQNGSRTAQSFAMFLITIFSHFLIPGKTFFSCGDDKLIKQWALEPESVSLDDLSPLNTITASHSLTSIDHHWTDGQFATSGDAV